jgi:hypothetical protein
MRKEQKNKDFSKTFDEYKPGSSDLGYYLDFPHKSHQRSFSRDKPSVYSLSKMRKNNEKVTKINGKRWSGYLSKTAISHLQNPELSRPKYREIYPESIEVFSQPCRQPTPQTLKECEKSNLSNYIDQPFAQPSKTSTKAPQKFTYSEDEGEDNFEEEPSECRNQLI